MKASRIQNHVRRGFTLIELLVVIAIIALLLAVIVPSLKKAKNAAKMMLCASNQHQIITGVNAYASDNDSQMPPRVAWTARPSLLNNYQDEDSVEAGNRPTSVYRTLGSYLPVAKIFNCPVSTYDNLNITVGSLTKDYQYFYENPQDSLNPNRVALYSLNCSFQLLWNYEFNPAPSVSDKPFTGPGKNSDVKLLTCDAFFFSNQLLGNYTPALDNRWISTHDFRVTNARISGDQHFPYRYYAIPGPVSGHINLINTDPTLQDVKLNAGYTDGSVVKFNSGDTVKVARFSNWANYWITTKWY